MRVLIFAPSQRAVQCVRGSSRGACVSTTGEERKSKSVWPCVRWHWCMMRRLGCVEWYMVEWEADEASANRGPWVRDRTLKLR